MIVSFSAPFFTESEMIEAKVKLAAAGPRTNRLWALRQADCLSQILLGLCASLTSQMIERATVASDCQIADLLRSENPH